MKRNILIGISIAITILIVYIVYIVYFVINTQPYGIFDVRKIQVPKYNPQISTTYKASYSKLKKQLLYARVAIIDPSTSKKETIKVITNKQQLLDIVREFDKLHATKPKEYNFEGPYTPYTIVMWRDGSSVSYVLLKDKTGFYEGSTIFKSKNNKLVLRKLPNNLVKLLEL